MLPETSGYFPRARGQGDKSSFINCLYLLVNCISKIYVVFLFFFQVGEARALYNIGNVFHAKGKQQLWGCTQEPGELPLDVRDTLQRATGFYE